jgi:hypothetical protein
MQNIKSGITFGIIGGLLTFLFGGWSVAVFGLYMGIGLGLLLSARFERTSMTDVARKAMPTALTAGGVLVLLSLIQNYVVQPALGKFWLLLWLYFSPR